LTSRDESESAAQPVDLVQVVVEGDRRLRAHRVDERLRRDVRVAVAVAADPRAHPQERRQPRSVSRAGREPRREVGVQARQLGEERVAVVREPVLDIVDHLQPREPQHRRLPEAQHAPVELVVDLVALGGRGRPPVAHRDELRDSALGVEDAPALDLGRVRGEHRAHA